jgi:hypothetical protein
MVKKSTHVPIEVIDGRTITSGAITHETTPLELYIGKHMEKIVLNIIFTVHHPIILGLPWLELHNPIIDWRFRTLTFSAQRCTSQEPQAQKNTLFSPAKNHVVRNPKRVGTNSNFLKSIMSSPVVKNPPMARTKPYPVKNLVQNPTQKTNPVRIFIDELFLSIGLLKIFKSSPSMSTQPTTKTPNYNQHMSNFPISTRTLLMFLKRIMLISSPPIV